MEGVTSHGLKNMILSLAFYTYVPANYGDSFDYVMTPSIEFFSIEDIYELEDYGESHELDSLWLCQPQSASSNSKFYMSSWQKSRGDAQEISVSECEQNREGPCRIVACFRWQPSDLSRQIEK